VILHVFLQNNGIQTVIGIGRQKMDTRSSTFLDFIEDRVNCFLTSTSLVTGIRPLGIDVVLILSSPPLVVYIFSEPSHVLMRIRNDEDKYRLKAMTRLTEVVKLQ
jgi:hypothetical protein